ncbi:MAG: hypothetical protein ACE5FV_05190 [Woeseia sp.]
MTEPDRMQWNLGGWLGAQLGGSVWILVAGILSLRADVNAALVVIGLFILANLIGLAIWRHRERLSAYAGIQLFLPVLLVVGLAAVYTMERAGIYETIQVGGSVSAGSTYGILVLVVLGLMLMFHFRFRRKR